MEATLSGAVLAAVFGLTALGAAAVAVLLYRVSRPRRLTHEPSDG